MKTTEEIKRTITTMVIIMFMILILSGCLIIGLTGKDTVKLQYEENEPEMIRFCESKGGIYDGYYDNTFGDWRQDCQIIKNEIAVQYNIRYIGENWVLIKV